MGTGVGQARNYEITLIKGLTMTNKYIIGNWQSDSYDNACHHDGVPAKVKLHFRLPQWHLAFRDNNHNINIAVEKTYESSPLMLTFIKSMSVIWGFLNHGSNILLLIQNYLGDTFLSFSKFATTKWTEHQIKPVERMVHNLSGLQHVFYVSRKETTIPGRKSINAFNIVSSSQFISICHFIRDFFMPLKKITKVFQAYSHIAYETPSYLSSVQSQLKQIVAAYKFDIDNDIYDTLHPKRLAHLFPKLKGIKLINNHISYEEHSIVPSLLSETQALTHNFGAKLKFDVNKKKKKPIAKKVNNQRANLNFNPKTKSKKRSKPNGASRASSNSSHNTRKKKTQSLNTPANTTKRTQEVHKVGTTLATTHDFAKNTKMAFYSFANTLVMKMDVHCKYPPVIKIMKDAFDIQKWRRMVCGLLTAARKSLKHIVKRDGQWIVDRWEPKHLEDAENIFKLLGCKQLNVLINIHNRSYKEKYAVKKTAIPQSIAVKNAFLKLTIRGTIYRSYAAYKILLRHCNRNKPIFYLFHWEFIRLLFTQLYKYLKPTEFLHIFKRCLVMDCPEPSNEGSVSILDNLIKGNILDEQLYDTFIIKCMFQEFTSKHSDLVSLIGDRWLNVHPSPICENSKYIHSPTVDKILYSRDDKSCNAEIVI
eukprot:1068646_1